MKSNKKLVSVIVPIYNVEAYLERCVISILNQTYENIEVILINDGSTDRSLDLAKRLEKKDKRIVLVSQDNQGLSAARNSGIKIARGEYITFVDSDDWIDKRFVEMAMSYIMENKSDIVSFEFVNAYDMSIRNKINNQYTQFDGLAGDALFGQYATNFAWGKVIRKKLIDEFEEIFPVGRHYEDIASMYKIFDRATSVTVSRNELYFYFVREGSITSKRELSDVQDKIITIEEICDYKFAHKYKYLDYYIYVKAFGAIADLYKIDGLDSSVRNEYLEKIYNITKKNPVKISNIRIRKDLLRVILIKIRKAHIVLKIKYRK